MSSANPFNDPELAIACPKCGERLKQKLSWLQANREFPCPACGVPFTVNDADIENAVNATKRAAEALDKLPPWMRRG